MQTPFITLYPHLARKEAACSSDRDRGSSPKTPHYSTRHCSSTTGSDNHLSCHVCGRNFFLKYHLECHLKQHAGNGKVLTVRKRFKCETCGRGFLNAGSLRRHRCSHREKKGEGGGHCEACGEIFHDTESLDEHRRLHVLERSLMDNFQCRVCKKTFQYKYSLQLHHCTFPPKQPPPFLLPHELRVMATTPFGCGICGEAFRSSSHLALHRQWHRNRSVAAADKGKKTAKEVETEKEYSFVCDFCGGSFQKREELEEHLECHDEARHKVCCGACGSVFYDRVRLEDHTRSHHVDLVDKFQRKETALEVSITDDKDVCNERKIQIYCG